MSTAAGSTAGSCTAGTLTSARRREGSIVRAKPTGPEAGFAGSYPLFLTIFAFSVVVNVLMLTGPLYMLQIYDRVLPSRSEETLLALTLLIAALYGFMGLLDYVRGRVSARIGATAQARLDARVFRAGLRRSVLPSERSKPATGLRISRRCRSSLPRRCFSPSSTCLGRRSSSWRSIASTPGSGISRWSAG